MSWQPCDDPQPSDRQACDLIDVVIVPRARDLGGFEVRRALPWSDPSSSSTRWDRRNSCLARAWMFARIPI